jgi:hypothetical protein
VSTWCAPGAAELLLQRLGAASITDRCEPRRQCVRARGARRRGDALENRIGDHPPLHGVTDRCRLPGVEERVDAGEFDEQLYASGWAVPPASLIEAIGEPGADPLYRRQSGEEFSDSMRAMKWSEWSRSLAHVTGWEHREHFEVF